MPIFGKDEIEQAARLVCKFMAPTPQYVWPLLCLRAGATVWVKHENHPRSRSAAIHSSFSYKQRFRACTHKLKLVSNGWPMSALVQ